MIFDVRGREIKVGQVVTYPGRRGSNLWVNLGTVVTVDDSFKRYSWSNVISGRVQVRRIPRHSWDGASKLVWIHAVENITIADGI